MYDWTQSMHNSKEFTERLRKMKAGKFTICPFCGGLVSLVSSSEGKDKFACDSCDMTIVTEHN